MDRLWPVTLYRPMKNCLSRATRRALCLAARSQQNPLPRARLDQMTIEVLPDSNSVAQRAASIIAEAAEDAVAARGRFVMAVSGGHTPWLMLRELASASIPWRSVHIVQ